MKENKPEAIKLNVNGKEVMVTVHPLKRLLDVLRDDLKLTGVKEGCGEGECGACSVLLNGELVNSCIIPVGAVAGAKIETIEGYRKTKRYRVIEDSFAEESAVQCGFCTPGFVMATEALLKRNPKPSEEEIRKGISGNLCRCTGYDPIVRGIKKAAEKGNGLW
ncbi:MAG: (2Fe-2S)-binding protein [Spirochaetales bacterium]|nr:(2Fe-2S)-binding protein [Spirochaetales bacterium]